MGEPRIHERKAKVKGIATSENIERYRYSIQSKFNSREVLDKGQYVVLHERIPLEDKTRIDIVVWTTDLIRITASYKAPLDNFDQIATSLISLAQDCTERVAERRPITFRRAGRILGYISGLNPDDEFERMIIIILADTSNEIALTEQMKAEKIGGSALLYGIPAKIKCLQDKGKVVYEADGIANIREVRNDIVHRGTMPDVDQAKSALDIAQKVLNWMLK